ncbi:hypothetical protein GALMADRAFT_717857 [Galerina marginata CBS 339.88]|uniref:Secreted protein n=1 Tax=Galerina marginata (strain CBS 339.88) TaxID=685588 RepID=A0A067TX81_GALM3|nr:hypothetical protein GALMADRAFT_717857 [Galerina marginata CBS 339.88]
MMRSVSSFIWSTGSFVLRLLLNLQVVTRRPRFLFLSPIFQEGSKLNIKVEDRLLVAQAFTGLYKSTTRLERTPHEPRIYQVNYCNSPRD